MEEGTIKSFHIFANHTSAKGLVLTKFEEVLQLDISPKIDK